MKEIIKIIYSHAHIFFGGFMDGFCKEMEDIHYCLQRHCDVRLFHRVFWEIEREEKLQTIIHTFCFPPGHSSVPSVEP